MRRKFGVILTVLILGSWTPATAQDQFQMNQQAAADFQRADRLLNQVYKRLLAVLTPECKSRLIKSELLWVKFRDADADAQGAEALGGTLYPTIYEGIRAARTRQRSKELQQWLDACAKK